jgi:hypothetical protein
VIKHTNRAGRTYYLHQGETKSGGASYFFSTKPDGPLAVAIPEAYEIYEKPNGQVFLRSVKTKLITEQELAIVEDTVRRLCRLDLVKVDVRKNTLTVLTAEDSMESDYERYWKELGVSDSLYKRQRERHAYYTAVLRFVLVDAKKRTFNCDRYCFRGSMEGWIHLEGPGTLKALADKYVPHLGMKSFYELFQSFQ